MKPNLAPTIGATSELALQVAPEFAASAGAPIVEQEVSIAPSYMSPEGGITTVDADTVTLGSFGPRKDSRKSKRVKRS